MADDNTTEIHLAGGAKVKVKGDLETVASALHSGRRGISSSPVRRRHDFAVLEEHSGTAVYIDPDQVVCLRLARSGVAAFV